MALRSSLLLALSLSWAACSNPQFSEPIEDERCDGAPCPEVDAVRDAAPTPPAPSLDASMPGSPLDADTPPGDAAPATPDASRLLGRYAVRAQFFGNDVGASGVISHEILYLAEITPGQEAGSFALALQPCVDRGKVSVAGGTFRFDVSLPHADRLPPRQLKIVVDEGTFRTVGAPSLIGYTAEPPPGCTPGRSIPRPTPAPWGSSCTCPSNTQALPTQASDCRVVDADGDGKPGLTSQTTGSFAGTSSIGVKDMSQLVDGKIADDRRHTASFQHADESDFIECGSITCRNANLTLCESRHNTVDFAPLPERTAAGQPFQCADVRSGLESGELIPLKPLAFPAGC